MGGLVTLGLASGGALALAGAARLGGARPGLATGAPLLLALAIGLLLLGLGAPADRALRGASAALLGLAALAFLVATARPWELFPEGSRALAAAALVVAVFAPWPLLRAAALAGVLVLAARERRLVLGARATGLLVFFLLVLALALPAWRRSDESRGLVLALAGLGALLLARVAARPTPLALPPPGPAWPAVLAIGAVLVLEAGPLSGPLAWRGDEDHHVCRAQAALELWTFERGFTALLAFALAALVLARATGDLARAGLGAVAAGALAGILALGGSGDEARLVPLDRYSPLETWAQAALAFAPATLPFPGLRFEEGWYRLLPLGSLLAAAALVARRAPLDAPGRLLAALALATVPSLHFHATLLYLEGPLVLALAALLVELGDEGWTPRASLALLVVPLLKETGLPAFLLLGGHGVLTALRGGDRREVLRRGVVVVLLVVLVLSLRRPGVRPFAPHLEALLSPTLWGRLPGALLEQTGGLVLLAPLGVVFAWRRGHAQHALLLVALFLGTLVFLALDGEAYFGLARFFLLLLPPLLALGLEAVRGLKPRVAWAVLGTVLLANLLLAPVGLSGARRPFFGEPLVASGELVYPWDRALAQLAPLGDGAEVAVLGQSYGYSFGLYAKRHGAAPALRVVPFPEAALQRALDRRRSGKEGADPEDVARLRSDLESEGAGRARAVVLQLAPGDVSPWPERAGGLERRLVLALGDCRLVVYGRVEGAR